MNPFKILWNLSIDPKEKFSITMLLLGVKDVVRIDLYKGDASPETVKLALLNLRLHFANMRLSGKPDHLAGLAVSKSLQLAQATRLACEVGDTQKLLELLGEQYAFPIKMSVLKDMNFPNRAPNLFEQMKECNLVAN